MKSFTQWNLNRQSNLLRYEEHTHPRFVSKYAGESMSFEDIYRILRSQAPDQWCLEPEDVLLDLGCGTGWYARRLSVDARCRQTNIIGFDLSENALEVARQNQPAVSEAASISYRQADLLAEIAAPPAREIWFCGTWHQTGDPLKALGHAAGALSRDGLLHIQTYSVDPKIRQPIDIAVMRLAGHQVFQQGEIAALAQKCGLKIAARTQKGMVELCTMRHA